MDCVECGERVPLRGGGPTGTYCSGACRQRAYRRRRGAGVPAWLKRPARWTRAVGKRPITPRGIWASSTNPNTWGTYADCQNGAGDGYGIMLGNGLGCIDLDNCFMNGELTPFAKGIVEMNEGAYIERSMSGSGLHIFGELNEGPGIKRNGIEVYSRGRFIRVTGDRFVASCRRRPVPLSWKTAL